MRAYIRRTMPSAPSLGRQAPAGSASAILEAAVTLYAHHGPDGTSLRDVASAAGLTHAMVARHFGDKDGLVRAVGDHVVAAVGALLEDAPTGTAGYDAVLRRARGKAELTGLLVRCGLGDLRPEGFPACLAPPCWGTPGTAQRRAGGRHRQAVSRYGSAALLLGWLTFDGFLVPAVGVGQFATSRRDTAMAAAAASVGATATTTPPPLLRRGGLAAWPTTGHRNPSPDHTAHHAIVAAAVELFALHGPASVSIRDVARRAGVNHGLVHRHVGSKDQLVAAAIAAATEPLLPGALATSGFDVDAAVAVVHRDPAAARLIARVLVDGIPIRAVRHRFPVMRGLVAAARSGDATTRPAALADPRLAAAAAASLALGSVVWGPWLSEISGLGDLRGHDVPAGTYAPEAALADMGRRLLGLPTGPAGA